MYRVPFPTGIAAKARLSEIENSLAIIVAIEWTQFPVGDFDIATGRRWPPQRSLPARTRQDALVRERRGLRRTPR